MRKLFLLIFASAALVVYGQEKLSTLSVEKIMRDPKWIGTSPSNPFWDRNGNLYFSWNPTSDASDSLYQLGKNSSTPVKVSLTDRRAIVRSTDLVFNQARTAAVYIKGGDIYLADLKRKSDKRITRTVESESQPKFGYNDTRIIFTMGQNLFAYGIADGSIVQLTNFVKGAAPVKESRKYGQQEKWLRDQQLNNFDVLRTRKQKRDATDSANKRMLEPDDIKPIYTDDRIVMGANISADGRFVSYRLLRPASGNKTTIVPAYVTESGFTEDLNGRTKVGAPLGAQELLIYDRDADSAKSIKTDRLEGVKNLPEYFKDYPTVLAEKSKSPVARAVNASLPDWSPKGDHAVIDFRSQDYKDRWLMSLDAATGKLTLVDHQHDSAWLGGPGIGGGFGASNTGWIDNDTYWFQSEVSGYSHLYSVNVVSGQHKTLTSGNYEVQSTDLSNDHKHFYITTNEVHPGEQHFYRLPVTGGKAERFTTMTGANLVTISPDEKKIAILYSYINKPWELFLADAKPGAKATQVTDKAQSAEFSSYPWRDAEVITFQARDGATVYARLYRPKTAAPSKPAVIFVHGAGYLQNAHKWWSSYFREYMFNNLLVDNGYTVLDIDYRASAGYGRNWRTGIYRFMGGKDLTDNVDGARLLVDKYGVDAKHIGMYGGSYGGFMTLMAMFTTPGVISAGAALRPVTDWANYNHGYTAQILNEPFNDSIAYKRSSPYYFANGLQGHLLICHGIQDLNVHFQDAVKLSQRLIELGKDNWEFAPYPMEDHGFVEPSSWTDEYKRIFKLFETNLK